MPTGIKLYDLMRELTDEELKAVYDKGWSRIDRSEWVQALENLIETGGPTGCGEKSMVELLLKVAVFQSLAGPRRPKTVERTNGQHRQGYGGQWR